MIQYAGSDQYNIIVGEVNAVFNLQDLQDMLDDLQNLGYDHPISERICTFGDLEKARDIAFECGLQEGRAEYKEGSKINEDMCG